MNIKTALLLLVLIKPFVVFSQDDNVVRTDSSVIETKYFDYLNSIRVFNKLNKTHKTYYTEYYFNTKKIKSKGVYVNDKSVGMWKEFAPSGTLVRSIDYDKGIFKYVDKKIYPFYDLQNNIKTAGDNFIAKMYSKDFLDNYVRWDIDGSYVSKNDDSRNWTDSLTFRPNKFLLRYDLRLEGKIYPEMIAFETDAAGKILIDFPELHGFEKRNDKQAKTFTINSHKALELLKQKRVVIPALAKPETFLYWENAKSNTIYNGFLRYYIAIKTKTIKNINPKGRSTIVNKFDVFIFDPWTSEYIGKKKMQKYTGWEQNSGSSSGLVPDN